MFLKGEFYMARTFGEKHALIESFLKQDSYDALVVIDTNMADTILTILENLDAKNEIPCKVHLTYNEYESVMYPIRFDATFTHVVKIYVTDSLNMYAKSVLQEHGCCLALF